MSVATSKQLFALFCGTGLNTQKCTLSLNQASNLISNMKNGLNIIDDLRSFGATGEPKKQKEDFQAVYDKAHNAGMEAALNHKPVPMHVVEHADPFDNNSPIIRAYEPVMDGVCGFAWISFKGNTSFGRWAKEKGLARKDYPTGLCIWVGQFNQSMEKKEKYASAFAKVLNENGITAYMGSRMD